MTTNAALSFKDTPAITRPAFSGDWKKKADALVKQHERAKDAYAKKMGTQEVPRNFPYSAEFRTGAIELFNQRKAELAKALKPNTRSAETRQEADALVLKEVTKALEIGNLKRLEEWLEKNERGQLDAKKKGKGTSGDKYARQDYLLTLLPDSSMDFNKGAKEAVFKELRGEGYEISDKTLGRDIKALIHRGKLQPGAPDDLDDADDDSDDDKSAKKNPAANGWHKNHKTSLRFESLSVTDALSLSLLENFLQPILPVDTVKKIKPIFQQAREKLKREVGGNKLARWIERVAVVSPTQPFLPPKLDDALLAEYHPGKSQEAIKELCDKASDTIRTCLFEEQQVEIRYVKPGAEPKWHTINPLGLVQRDQITYLIATFPTDRKNPPTIPSFALHRVIEAKKAYLPAKAPENFSLQAHLASGAMGFSEKGKIKLKAWFEKRLGDSLAQTKLSEDQTIRVTEDGVELTATVVDNWTLRWWILSKTGDIVVLEPESLREDIAKQLSDGAARYD
ncbi:MAG: WYL domain-containing protein [Thiobacillus sp.]|nr:WYL domain-containing protein [Thiobacillus sp.]